MILVSEKRTISLTSDYFIINTTCSIYDFISDRQLLLSAAAASMSVLLIGSTGMGKSTFGNFLMDPTASHMFDHQTFPTATDNKPTTKEVKDRRLCLSLSIDSAIHHNVELVIIDTPGLNESAVSDLSHMIQIIKKLNEHRIIRACILIVKFNAKIDTQYKATMEYYSKLLPGLFDSNVIIVLTDFATDPRSELMREKQHIDVEAVKRNTVLELSKCSNSQLTYSPQIFTLDCLPLGGEEIETSLQVREAILNFIMCLNPVEFATNVVAKTSIIKQADARKYDQLQGQILGYSTRLKEVHKESKEVLDETHKKEVEINTVQSKLRDLDIRLQQLDKCDEVIACHDSVEESWKFLRRISRELNLLSAFKIIRYDHWTNGKCEFIKLEKNDFSIKGKIDGHFMRGIYATITAYTEKRIKYAGQIKKFKNEIEEENKKLEKCKSERDEFLKKQKEHKHEVNLLQKYIDDRRMESQKYTSDLMEYDEAIARLTELKQKR